MSLPQTYQKEEKETQSRYTMGYLKKEGEKVKIRILSDFIDGKSVWGEKDGKPFPYRFRMNQTVPVACIGVNQFSGRPNTIKKFLAAVVWDYTTKQVEILEIDKSSLKDTIFDLEHDEDWGNSTGYDLTISRSGQGQDTRYSMLPSNKGPFRNDVPWKYIRLDALYDGENPFERIAEKEMKAAADESLAETTDIEDISSEIPF